MIHTDGTPTIASDTTAFRGLTGAEAQRYAESHRLWCKRMSKRLKGLNGRP